MRDKIAVVQSAVFVFMLFQILRPWPSNPVTKTKLAFFVQFSCAPVWHENQAKRQKKEIPVHVESPKVSKILAGCILRLLTRHGSEPRPHRNIVWQAEDDFVQACQKTNPKP